MKIFSENESITLKQGEIFAEELTSPCVVALTGEVGAGKTVFAKGIAKGLKIHSTITSPTFTFINIYKGTLPFYHIDAYRLDKTVEQNVAAALEIGLDEYIDGDGVCVVEWAENIMPLIPKNAITVTITKKDNGRVIEILNGQKAGQK